MGVSRAGDKLSGALQDAAVTGHSSQGRRNAVDGSRPRGVGAAAAGSWSKGTVGSRRLSSIKEKSCRSVGRGVDEARCQYRGLLGMLEGYLLMDKSPVDELFLVDRR